MAKQSSMNKNKRRRAMVAQYAGKRAKLKELARDRSKPVEERFAAQLKLAQLPRNSSATRIRNRCSLSGRPRAYIGKFGVSRITFRELALSGKIPGVTKSSW
jgi:small subunit ribosomal protein S14